VGVELRFFSLLLFCIGCGGSFAAHARLFNYAESTVAPYLRGVGGFSGVRQSPYGNSSGGGTDVDRDYKYQYSGELGVQFGLGEDLHLRLGAEIGQHGPVTDAIGVNTTSGAKRFSLDSSVFMFNPNVSLSYIFSRVDSWRFFVYGGVGLASVTVENRYKMTAAGTAQLGGVTDFNEKMEGSAVSFHMGTGFEMLFVDNVTVGLDLGYRYLKVNTLKYTGDMTTILSPTTGVSKGEQAKDHDGNNRFVDLSGATVGLTFRFYF